MLGSLYPSVAPGLQSSRSALGIPSALGYRPLEKVSRSGLRAFSDSVHRDVCPESLLPGTKTAFHDNGLNIFGIPEVHDSLWGAVAGSVILGTAVAVVVVPSCSSTSAAGAERLPPPPL